MMKKAVSILFCGLILTSCFSPSAYVQKSTYIPAFEGNNELKIGATIAPPNELNAAYTPINHLGIVASGIYKTSSGKNAILEDTDIPKSQKFLLGELGLGYYTNWNDNQWFFETYGGFGLGSSEYSKALYEWGEVTSMENFKSGISQFFLTPAGGYRIRLANNAKIIGILSSNFSGVRFSDFNEISSAPQVGQTYYFLSPGLTVRTQISFFEFQFQGINHFQLNKNTISTDVPVFYGYIHSYNGNRSRLAVTVGVSVNIHQLVQTIRKK